MALIQFKRISPNPPPTEAESQEIARLMLAYLMGLSPLEREEFYEPDEPLLPDTEFIENKCPECGGYWQYPNLLGITDRSDPAYVSQHVGHYAHCKRWLKHWEYKDVRNNVLYRS